MLANPSGLHSRPHCPYSSHFSLSSRCKLSLSPNCPCLINSRKSSKFRSLSWRFIVKSLAQEPQVSDSETLTADAPPTFPQPVSVKIPYGDRHVSFLLICTYYLFLLIFVLTFFFCVVLEIDMSLCCINIFQLHCVYLILIRNLNFAIIPMYFSRLVCGNMKCQFAIQIILVSKALNKINWTAKIQVQFRCIFVHSYVCIAQLMLLHV